MFVCIAPLYNPERSLDPAQNIKDQTLVENGSLTAQISAIADQYCPHQPKFLKQNRRTLPSLKLKEKA